MHLPTQLRQPGAGHVGAGAVVVGEDDAGAAHAGVVVGFLHQLAAGDPARVGQVAGAVFLFGAHVEQVGGAAGLGAPVAQLREAGAVYAGLVGHGAGCLPGLFAGFNADVGEAPLLAVLQCLPGQGPADGAVAQGGHRVGDAGVHQGLGADDAAGAPGAVDDHPGARVRRQFTHTQHQFGAGHADGAGDVHGLVLVEAAGVEHHHVGLGVQQRLHLFSGEGGCGAGFPPVRQRPCWVR